MLPGPGRQGRAVPILRTVPRTLAAGSGPGAPTRGQGGVVAQGRACETHHLPRLADRSIRSQDEPLGGPTQEDTLISAIRLTLTVVSFALYGLSMEHVGSM